jgi:transcriptional regulator with XRE-family HTH domain
MTKNASKPATQTITDGLRAAREAKGLSQRALADLTGVGQANISRIESGGQDLRLSKLTEIARALELELVLVPRGRLAAVASFLRTGEAGATARPAYRLDEDDELA